MKTSKRGAAPPAALVRGAVPSSAEAALAAADVAALIVAQLLSPRVGGTAADLARVECVCGALRRAAAPHWRALCLAHAPAVAQQLEADGEARRERWRALRAQLHRASFHVMPQLSCSDFTFLLDVSFDGAPLLSCCFDRFAAEEHAARDMEQHALAAHATALLPLPPAAAALTAGDLYDWPTRLKANLYVRRATDGALAVVMRGKAPQWPVAQDSHDVLDWDDSSDDDGEPHGPGHTCSVEVSRLLRGQAPLSVRLRLYFEAADLAEAPDHMGQAEPLFFRGPGYLEDDDELPGYPGRLPRRPLHENARLFSGGYHVGNGTSRLCDSPPDVPIAAEALARRLLPRRWGGPAVELCLRGRERHAGDDSDYDSEMFDAHDTHAHCHEVCAALERLVYATEV